VLAGRRRREQNYFSVGIGTETTKKRESLTAK
jgi:hypothetical protein